MSQFRTKITVKRAAVVAAACMTLVPLSACGSSDSASGKGDIKIGIVTSLTGSANVLGLPEMDSYKLAVKLINEAGGIDGRKVTTVVYDDKSTPQEAVKAVQRMISRDEVVGIIGGLSSPATLAVKPVVEQNKVPLISAHVAASTTADNPKFLFRSVPNDRVTTERMVEYLTEHKLKNLALLYDSNAYGSGAKDLFEEVVPAANGAVKIVTAQSYDTSATDLRSQLTKIKAINPDAIALLGTNPSPAIAIKQAAELGLKAQFIGGTGIISQATIDVAGKEAAQGVVSVGYGDPSCPRPEQKAFVDQFKAEYNKAPEGFNYAGDGMYLMLEALKKVSLSDDLAKSRQSLRDQIEALRDVSWAMGPWNYAPDNHDGADTRSLVSLEVVDGDWHRTDCQQ